MSRDLDEAIGLLDELRRQLVLLTDSIELDEHIALLESLISDYLDNAVGIIEEVQNNA